VKVSLFITCYNDSLFPKTGQAVVEVLERLGHEVEFRAEQTCCGQVHWNTGYLQEAIPVIRKFVKTFLDAECVVVPSSSCVAMVRDHYLKAAHLAQDSKLACEVELLIPRVFEFTEFLLNRLGVEDIGAVYPHRVTYHASCHSVRSLNLGDGPIRLLKKVKRLELQPIDDPDKCCGFGGTFAVKNFNVSAAMLSEAVRTVLNTGAEVLTAVDNSCLMHIFGSLHRQGTPVRTAHIAEILASQGGEL
jgi:L-lactate dehydrogenase complex protein LldE